MNVHVLITFTAAPEKRAAFAELLARVRLELPQVPGCTGVRVFQHRGAPCTFTLLETWESESKHNAHFEHIVRSGTWEHIASYLDAEPVSSYCDESV